MLAERAVVLDASFGSDPIWSAVIDIAEAMRQDEWSLIGGQMVSLHGFIAGAVPPRATTDIDIVVDDTVRAGALQRCAAVLESLQFDPNRRSRVSRCTDSSERAHQWICSCRTTCQPGCRHGCVGIRLCRSSAAAGPSIAPGL
jgi:hypothetical protein